MFKILFLGDVVGSPGRRTIKKLLPEIKKKNEIDFVIANVDNLTHGMGPTRDKIEEILAYGVDFCTNGDHVFRFRNFYNDLEDESLPVIRGANYPESSPGRGYQILDLGRKGQILIINLIGQVFIRDNPDSPFLVVNRILEKLKDVQFVARIVDFHAEATSEKRALGYYLDGRVTAVLGTHTHVPTSDVQILPQGTAYVTDAGMVGTKCSILGEKIESVIPHYLSKTPHRYMIEEEGETALHSVLVTVKENGLASKIKRIDMDLKK